MTQTFVRNRDSPKSSQEQLLFWPNYCWMLDCLAPTSSCLPLLLLPIKLKIYSTAGTGAGTRDLPHVKREFCHWAMLTTWCRFIYIYLVLLSTFLTYIFCFNVLDFQTSCMSFQYYWQFHCFHFQRHSMYMCTNRLVSFFIHSSLLFPNDFLVLSV